MLPLLPFTLGILTGAAAIKLVRSNKAKAGLQRAQVSIREATLSSLTAIETTSARARDKLASAPAVNVPEPVAEAVAAKRPAKPASKPRTRKPAVRKTAAKSVAETTGS